ncbi:MAG TPA: UshA-like (seleno)protein [Haliangium sp.]|nr:UshA-like (seleno)protein [Haliangium sp.]
MLALALGAACSASPTTSKLRGAEEPSVTIFATTELRGQTEPCGCTTNPLGDLARTAQMILDLRKRGRPVLVVDGGSLLYTSTAVPEHVQAQERLKADLLSRAFTRELDAAAIGLGPYDLGMDVPGVQMPRQAANVSPESGVPLAPPRVVEAGSVRVGVFGVVSPAALEALGVNAGDPVAAARDAVAGLRQQGARLVVGLAHMTRKEAADLARAVPGIDFLIVGQNAPEPDQVAEAPLRVNDTYLVQPANRGQVITRLDVTVRDQQGALTDAIGQARADSAIRALDAQIESLTSDLARWRADPSAEAGFVQAKERELATLQEQRDGLRARPLQAPDKGSWFVMAQVSINKKLPCNQEIQRAKTAFNKAAGEANVAAAAGQEPPPVPAGKAGYVGAEECSMCHAEATEFWQKTKHHQAWETLEAVNKQFDYECIGCHVTGFAEPGGATLARNEHLRDVQCEVCHGPGSLHVEADGADQPRTVVRTPAESLCKGCHSAEHSDTFDFTAYLRDVTGPGHGPALRQELGDGPTGLELRRAGLEKAGMEIGAGCQK